ncbi:hypothetical protein KSF78_0009005 [Schistosoma japonicum]|nr:hypothetical protein KSF78_0009005 [Schistosoma japonicum]
MSQDSKIIEARGEFKYFDKKSIKFRKYVTDEDEENWTICIMYHEEECIKDSKIIEARGQFKYFDKKSIKFRSR